MAKIIQFPKEKMKTPPQSKKELDAELLNNKVAYVDDVANHYSSSVFNKLAMHGFNVDDENFRARLNTEQRESLELRARARRVRQAQRREERERIERAKIN